VDDVLEAVIARIPPPRGDPAALLQALIIDSWFDNYVGVVMLVRVMEGTLRPRDRILLMVSGAAYNCEQVGVFTPKSAAREALAAGDVGFVIAGIKELKAARVGDTVTRAARPRRCPASRRSSRRSSRGSIRWRRTNTKACACPREAEAQRRLAALRPEVSQALGFGFRCGFLGLLHMDIVQERLERELRHGAGHHGAHRRVSGAAADGTVMDIENPAKLPDLSRVERSASRSSRRRSSCRRITSARADALHREARRAEEHAIRRPAGDAPLRAAAGEVVMDFFDRLKSVSRGYASLDYEFREFRAADVVKLES
jgi:GTP-binding protein LepA